MEVDFREAYQDDLTEAFFDEDVFASRHTIDGKECTIVLTEAKSEGARRYYGRSRSTFNPKETSVNKASYIIYVREKDIKRKLTTNAMINLDGSQYFIIDVGWHEGVYTLVVGIHTV